MVLFGNLVNRSLAVSSRHKKLTKEILCQKVRSGVQKRKCHPV